MPTREFETVVQRLATHVPGCPFPVIEKYVRDAAIEACEKTLAWKYEQPAIRLTPGLHSYLYEPPSNAEVHAIIHVQLNGSKIWPCTLEDIYERFEDWPNLDVEARGRPRFVTNLDADTFGVALVPDDAEDYDVFMMVALKPLRTATGMDEATLDDMENTVMDGALSQLYRLPEKSWSDSKLADYHGKKFISRCTERRARANLGAARATVAVRHRPFA